MQTTVAQYDLVVSGQGSAKGMAQLNTRAEWKLELIRDRAEMIPKLTRNEWIQRRKNWKDGEDKLNRNSIKPIFSGSAD